MQPCCFVFTICFARNQRSRRVRAHSAVASIDNFRRLVCFSLFPCGYVAELIIFIHLPYKRRHVAIAAADAVILHPRTAASLREIEFMGPASASVERAASLRVAPRVRGEGFARNDSAPDSASATRGTPCSARRASAPAAAMISGLSTATCSRTAHAAAMCRTSAFRLTTANQARYLQCDVDSCVIDIFCGLLTWELYF